MEDEYDFSSGVRGAVVPDPARITLRLDDDVLDWFRAQVDASGGGDYRSMIRAALRDHIQQRREPLEETLRRVIRDELRRIACYTAVIQHEGDCWIRWIEEVPGVNSQGATRDELVENLRSALHEALEMESPETSPRVGQTRRSGVTSSYGRARWRVYPLKTFSRASSLA